MWYLRKLSHIRDAFKRRVNVLNKENFHFHEETDVVTHLNLIIESIPYKRGEMWNSVNVGSKMMTQRWRYGDTYTNADVIDPFLTRFNTFGRTVKEIKHLCFGLKPDIRFEFIYF